jgi:hypothetical protein
VNRFRRRTLVLLTSLLVATGAASAHAQAAHSFPEIKTSEKMKTSHKWAYVSMVAGAGLIAASFPLANHADDLYADYAVATDPDQIEQLYDETIRYDWYARGALIGGEVLMGFGLYLRFIRQPRHDRPEATLDLRLEPGRCALAFSF